MIPRDQLRQLHRPGFPKLLVVTPSCNDRSTPSPKNRQGILQKVRDDPLRSIAGRAGRRPGCDYQIKKSWIHTGPEAPSAADRRMANKAGAEEFLRSWWDNHARAMARWARIKATPPLAPMIKALKAETEE